MDLILKNLRTMAKAEASVDKTMTAGELIDRITNGTLDSFRALLSDEEQDAPLKLLLLRTGRILEASQRLMDQGVFSGDRLGLTLELQLDVDVGLEHGGVIEMRIASYLTPVDLLTDLQESGCLSAGLMRAVRMFHGDENRRLPLDQSFDELGVENGDRLIVVMKSAGEEDLPFLRSDMGTVYRIKRTMATIGRSDLKSTFKPDIDLRHEDEGDTVSRDHGQIVYQNQGWYFVENPDGTTNGTMVESTGRKLRQGESLPLKNGTRIRIGKVWLKFNG